MTAALTLVAGYLVFLIGMSAAAMPYRKRMRVLAGELLETDLSLRERQLIEHMLATAYSWRGAAVIFFAYATGLVQTVQALDAEARECAKEFAKLFSDRRFHDFADAHFVSVVGVNPIIGIFAAVARMLFRLKAILHRRSRLQARQLTDLRAATVEI